MAYWPNTKRKFGIAALLALLPVGAALAGPVSECWQQVDDNVALGACLVQVEKNVDAAMDQTLGFAMAHADEMDNDTGRVAARPSLLAAQQAWVTYRDAHCGFVGGTFGGGSGAGSAILGCRITLGRARADVLLGFVN